MLQSLAGKYQWDELYLFGSLIAPGRFSPDSDIDIAVSGLDKQALLPFIAEASRELGRNVDVLRLEESRQGSGSRYQESGVRNQKLKRGKSGDTSRYHQDYTASIHEGWPFCSTLINDDIFLFLSVFDQQVVEIRKIYALLEEKSSKAQPQASSKLVESIGYWLHNLYSAYEDLFRLIAAFWENSLESSSTYHIELLRRMCLEIPGVRPAALSSKISFQRLDEMRAFRHVFRHAYSYWLDDERVFFLLRRVLESKNTILGDISSFRSYVADLPLSGE